MHEPVDHRLIGELFDRHGAALALYARQWTTAADDCVQEALVELARQPATPANLAAWLYRVVRNRAFNAARSERRRRQRQEAVAQARNEGAAPSAGTEQVELEDMLATLADEDREIVVLRIWGGLAWQEIAEVVGGSKSTAQRRYVDSLAALRMRWEPKSCRTN